MTKEEFNTLIDKYLSGQASPEEERLIDDFFSSQQRKASSEHYGLSNEMWSVIEGRIREERTAGTPAWHQKKIMRARVLVPAAIAVFCIISATIFFNPFRADDQEEWITSEAPYGQKAIITLRDGSRVFLNAGSRIFYPNVFKAGKREVRLSGEAFFEVTKDPARPFVIESEGVLTQVLGTSFNIEAFPGMPVQVTVATGRVQVKGENNMSGASSKNSAEPLILMPNQQATYDPVGKFFQTTEVDTTKFLAWKNNTIYFEDTSMKQAAAELERWFNVVIDLEAESIGNCIINGQYKDQSLANILKSFQHIYHIEYKFLNQNTIILYGKGCH